MSTKISYQAQMKCKKLDAFFPTEEKKEEKE